VNYQYARFAPNSQTARRFLSPGDERRPGTSPARIRAKKARIRTADAHNGGIPLEATMTGRRFVAGVAVVALCSTFVGVGAAAAQTPAFDGRGWTVGNQQTNQNESLTEYVLPGQTVDNWKELVTSTVFFQPVPLNALVDRIHASMAQGCPSLVWNVVTQNEKTIVFEWRDAGCGGYEPQSEIDRVTIESDGLYRLAYAVKGKAPLAAAKRSAWLAIMNQSPPAEGKPAARPGRGSQPTAAAQGNPPVKKFTPDELAAGVRRAGWPCATAAKSELKGQTPGPAGPLTIWLVECSGGERYSVMIDPSGAMTSFPVQK
jgi:hypothetical protein